MRMTLTIDDDVAAELNRIRRQKDASLKDVVNNTLRSGLRAAKTRQQPRKPFRMMTFDGGEQLIPIDNVAEALAILEGEDYK
jgi:Arc/MetJ family transcription regulator